MSQPTQVKQLKDIEQEQQQLFKKREELNRQYNEITTRLIELQGIIKYIKEKESDNKESKTNGNKSI